MRSTLEHNSSPQKWKKAFSDVTEAVILTLGYFVFVYFLSCFMLCNLSHVILLTPIALLYPIGGGLMSGATALLSQFYKKLIKNRVLRVVFTLAAAIAPYVFLNLFGYIEILAVLHPLSDAVPLNTAPLRL